MKPALTVVGGGAEGLTGSSALEAAYEHFRLNLLGNRVSENTVRHYDYMVRPFLAWAAEEGLRRFEEVPVERVRHYRAEVASRTTRAGRQLQGRSVLDSHKALMTFFRWAAEEEYRVDQKILSLKRPRVPEKEPTVYHIAE